MHRTGWGAFLMLLALAACSDETPTAPSAQDEPADGSASIDKAVVAPTRLPADGLRSFDVADGRDRRHRDPRQSPVTRRTWKSAHKVVRAAKAYARDNEGWFPTSISTRNPRGRNLIDYLPGGRLLTNFVTGARTEPSDGAAAYTGAVGYLAIYDNDGYVVGFAVSAVGASLEETLIIEHRRD